jgi:hypothetical protein
MSARGNRTFVAGLLVIAGLIPLAWWLTLREPPVSPPPPVLVVDAAPPDAAPGLPQLKLGAATGHVQVRHGDAGWVDAQQGEVLAANDGLRTDDGSTAELLGGEFWEVRLEPGTEIGVGELSASISRLLLESGMAHATVHGGGRHTFEVRAAHSDALASADGGAFTFATNGKGTVAVGTASGEVLFSAGGRVVIVRAGQQSLARPGQAPTPPAAIPSSLLLKVALPAKDVINTPRVVVRGTSEPGALITIDGHVITPDAEGHFSSTVTLKEGVNQVRVNARGVGDGVSQSVHRLELDTNVSAPVIDKNLWK